jgi:putative flippase GtrA
MRTTVARNRAQTMSGTSTVKSQSQWLGNELSAKGVGACGQRSYETKSNSSQFRDLVSHFAKFALVGSSGVGVNMAMFWLLTGLLDVQYLLAGLVAIEVALCSNYALNNLWTFSDRRSGRAVGLKFVRYHLVSIGGMLINLAVLRLLVELAGLIPMLSNLIGIGVATAWNFAVNFVWTWRRVTPSPEST